MLIDGAHSEIRRVAYDAEAEIAAWLQSNMPVRSRIAATLSAARFAPPPEA